jgi:adenine-specific DNA-methyltransferase
VRRPETDPRKTRGAFFTPEPIAEHLAGWAVRSDPSAKILDPTCGDGAFLLAAGKELRAAGCQPSDLDERLFGVDSHADSLTSAMRRLESNGLDAHLVADDFFAVPTPDLLGAPLPQMDAVIGNPPFVRYQHHSGDARRRSMSAALRQGVRINGLASSWAALLIHACGFLKPAGRLAMVLPAELLTVGYAEPVRTWLRRRFAKVHLVLFERLQFEDALEKVVLVLAEGIGGCDAFSLYHVEDAPDLREIKPYENWSVTPAMAGKWTDLLLPHHQRQLFKRVNESYFVPLSDYGSTELGTVTGANKFFTLSESTRQRHGLLEDQLVKISPPGTKHLQGTTFSAANWRRLQDADERVWLLNPQPNDCRDGLMSYIAMGKALGVDEAYKCQIRSPWWRPPVVSAPDFFFTYMSHLYPRLIANTASVTFVNSMHGVSLHTKGETLEKSALPLLCLNSVTMIGAEIFGRSYGGGILKMEPREASILPVPSRALLQRAWHQLRQEKDSLERQLKVGTWTSVVKRVDAALLGSAAGLSDTEVAELLEAARLLRVRRVGREVTGNYGGDGESGGPTPD